MSFLGFTQYSISEINTASSSTSDHELYVDAEFMSKDGLITCIGKRALKERFEFRVKRSSKTRYVASCIVEDYTFEVRAVGVAKLGEQKKLQKEASLEIRIPLINFYHHTCTLLKKPTKAYIKKECSYLLSELKEVTEDVNDDATYNTLLREIGLPRWTRAYCTVHHFNFMTSNAAEGLNASIRHVHNFPVCPLLESIRAMYQKWFYERRTDSSRHIEILTQWATDELKVNDDLGISWGTSNNNVFLRSGATMGSSKRTSLEVYDIAAYVEKQDTQRKDVLRYQSVSWKMKTTFQMIGIRLHLMIRKFGLRSMQFNM
ncbi:hypothetical protein PTKIN_Ptkin05aG0156600 [Pterospermum kingtungense]